MVPIVQPSMVQLIMDSQKQHYNVFAAGYMDSGRMHPFAQEYDSRTKGWTMVGSRHRLWDHISGYNYVWDNDDGWDTGYYSGQCEDPCMYDFAKGGLQDYGWCSSMVGRTFEVSKNRLFVLHVQARLDLADLVPANDLSIPRKFCILEYHLQKNVHAWVKVETHDCSPFDKYFSDESEHVFGKIMQLVIYVCNRFLMVWLQSRDIDAGWLYDLSTHDWRKLSNLRDRMDVDFMCELRWDSVP